MSSNDFCPLCEVANRFHEVAITERNLALFERDAALRERDEAIDEILLLRAREEGEPWASAKIRRERDEAVARADNAHSALQKAEVLPAVFLDHEALQPWSSEVRRSSGMMNCEICGRRLGLGDESKGEPPVDLSQCPRTGCFECLAIADVKCEYERQIAHLKQLAEDGARAYMKAKEADDAYMRSLGLSHTAIYRVMSEHENAQISFSRLVELVRTAARTMAEEEVQENEVLRAREEGEPWASAKIRRERDEAVARADKAHEALRAAEQRELKSLAALNEAIALIRIIVEADCLQPHAFDRGDDDASVYEACKHLIHRHKQ